MLAPFSNLKRALWFRQFASSVVHQAVVLVVEDSGRSSLTSGVSDVSASFVSVVSDFSASFFQNFAGWFFSFHGCSLRHCLGLWIWIAGGAFVFLGTGALALCLGSGFLEQFCFFSELW